MWKKIHDKIQWVCDSIELIVAIMVAVVLMVVFAMWLPKELGHIIKLGSVGAFMEFMEEVLYFVVGIEFIKLMCKPNTENVIEVLIFVIARHMVVGNIGGVELFLYVLAITLLIVVQHMPNRMLHHLKNMHGEDIVMDDEEGKGESEASDDRKV